MRERWEHQLPDVPLVIVESPYRALVGPMLAYLDVLDRTWPEDKEHPITFVVIPEYVARQLVGAAALQPVGRTDCGRRSRPARTQSWSTFRTGATTARASRATTRPSLAMAV